MTETPKHALDQLVVGMDGSSMATEGLRWAAGRVSPDGRLHVVHAFPIPTQVGLAILQKDWVEVRNEAQRSLEGPWTEEARDRGHEVITHLVEDDPADALLSVAETTGSSAIVVGRRGSGGRLPLLGSVTARLLRRSPLPVIVVGDDTPTAPEWDRSPVVACVGYGEATERAAEWAAGYAESTGRALSLIHVVGFRPLYPLDSPRDTLASYLGPGVSEDWAREDLADLAAEIGGRHPDLTISTNVEMGFAAPAMAAASVGAHLVVVGKRHDNPIRRGVISPRLQRLLCQAAAPVAVVPACSSPR